MNSRNKILLTIDGIVNLILGILLLLFPFGIAEYFGVPKSNNYFYPTILGGIILGIGIALLFERYGYPNNFRGLGIGGAIIIIPRDVSTYRSYF
jgi:ABC-type spermidine/putrescine transport system permease subunit II